MTVVAISKPGGPEVLVPEQRSVPKPGPGELLCVNPVTLAGSGGRFATNSMTVAGAG